MAKIEQSFEYQSELAKKNFQVNITSLLEMEKVITEKGSRAKTPHVCFSKGELEVLQTWIMKVVTDLSADYTIIERTNKLVNVNNRILEGLLERRTPNLKSLLKA